MADNIRRLVQVETEKARVRQKELAGKRKGDLKEIFPQGESGQARDLAAKKLGVSGKTMENESKYFEA